MKWVGAPLTPINLSEHNARRVLKCVSTKQAAVPGCISRWVLKLCADQWAPVFTMIFSRHWLSLSHLHASRSLPSFLCPIIWHLLLANPTTVCLPSQQIYRRHITHLPHYPLIWKRKGAMQDSCSLVTVQPIVPSMLLKKSSRSWDQHLTVHVAPCLPDRQISGSESGRTHLFHPHP